VDWDLLRRQARRRTAGLPVPVAAAAGRCQTCRAPVGAGYRRCFQCELHAQSAPGLLADTVAPAAYAAKGGPLARDLWQYKAGGLDSRDAGAQLVSLLVVFLHDHGHGIWREAGMTRPSHLCVVPSGRGRAGPHPLRLLAARYLTLPWVGLCAQPGADQGARSLDPRRFRATQPLAGAAVLLLDDTWVSGGSAQSAAVALKLAGARVVAVVVLGRHVSALADLNRVNG
jgi:hypothetical protein